MGRSETVYSKWVIKGLDGFVFGSDKEVYRLPFNSGRNYYGLRKIARQKGKRWKLDSVWWSERQLENKISLNSTPQVLVDFEEYLPF